MGFVERLSHLFSFGMRTFKQVGVYQKPGSASVSIDLIELENNTEAVDGVSKFKTRVLIKASDVAQPAYRDKITFESLDWYVERFKRSQDKAYLELALRRDEKLVL